MTTTGTHIGIHRGWFVFLGIALIVLGLVAVAVPLAATMAVELLVGWLFVFGGVAHVVHAVGARGAHGIWPPLFLGLLYLVGGVFFLLCPLGGMLTLTLVLAVFLALEGAGKIGLALRRRPRAGWVWIFLAGLLSVLMAIIIWAEWPGSAAWVIGLLVGINLFYSGVALLTCRGGSPSCSCVSGPGG